VTRLRVAVLFVCMAMILYSVGSVSAGSRSAAPEISYVCCSATECDVLGQTCCDAASLGIPPCTDDLPGICMSKCVILSGSGGQFGQPHR
jgi:hypothetical protein